MSLGGIIGSGRDRLLEAGWAYEILQWAVGSARARKYFLNKICPIQPGARILEIGCGPGTLVPYLGGQFSEYFGYDPNPKYIESAKEKFSGPKYHFRCGKTEDAAVDTKFQEGCFDVVISAAVLHHLDDAEATQLMELASFLCGQRGVFASYDNAFVGGQNPVAKKLIGADRGKYVRTPIQYESLIRGCFSGVHHEIRHNLMSVPYTLIFFRAVNSPESVSSEGPTES